MACPSACPLPCPKAPATHSAASLDLRPLQGDGDAVEKNECQDDIIKELVGDDGLTQDPEPGQGGQGPRECCFALTLSRRKAEGPSTHGDRITSRKLTLLSSGHTTGGNFTSLVPTWSLLP